MTRIARTLSIAAIAIIAILATISCAMPSMDFVQEQNVGALNRAITFTNPGFDGSLSGWTEVEPAAYSTNYNTGPGSAKISSSTGQIKQVVTGLAYNTTYTLSAVINGYAKIGVRNYGGTEVSKSVNSSTWISVEVTFTTGASNSTAEVFAAWVGTPTDARVDDFALVVSGVPTPTPATPTPATPTPATPTPATPTPATPTPATPTPATGTVYVLQAFDGKYAKFNTLGNMAVTESTSSTAVRFTKIASGSGFVWKIDGSSNYLSISSSRIVSGTTQSVYIESDAGNGWIFIYSGSYLKDMTEEVAANSSGGADYNRFKLVPVSGTVTPTPATPTPATPTPATPTPATPTPATPTPAVPAGTPGMRNTDGSVRATHVPQAFTGTRRDVTSYGANTGDNTTDDRPAIEAAINAAQPGDEVYLPNGTYNLNSFWSTDSAAHIRLKSDIRFVGQSQTGVILKSNKDDGGTLSYYGIKILGVDDVYLANFTITNTWSKTYSTETEGNSADRGGLTYAIATGANGTVITQRVTMENITVEKFRRMGFRIAGGSKDIVVKTSIAKNATDVGDGGAGYGFTIQGYGHLTAATNPFLAYPEKDCLYVVLDGVQAVGPYIRHGVIIQYWAHNSLVKNSTFTTNQLDAIDLHGEDEYSNEIAYNTVNGGLRAGVALGNSAAGHDNTGKYNWVHHNTMDNCLWGVTIEYGTMYTTLEDNIIRNCTKSTGRGIVLGFSIGSVIRRNTITSNTGSSYNGVRLEDDPAEGEQPGGGPRNWTITGNTITNSGTAFVDAASLDSGNTIQTTW